MANSISLSNMVIACHHYNSQHYKKRNNYHLRLAIRETEIPRKFHSMNSNSPIWLY